MRIFTLPAAVVLFASLAFSQDADAGRVLFEKTCARCHGADGNGGEMGPPIGRRLAQRDDQQLATLIRNGLPQQGMPPNQVDRRRDGAAHPLPAHLAAASRAANRCA